MSLTASRKKWLVIILAIGVLGGAAVLYWFEPQKAFIDERVDEEAPVSGDSPSGPVALEGDFIGLGHDAEGKALVLEAEGKSFLRFEDFEVSNGPDLRVYLSSAPAANDSDHDRDFVDLGDLKANMGNQNYEIPDGTDLEKYKTAVVWCRRFSVGFAAADMGAKE